MSFKSSDNRSFKNVLVVDDEPMIRDIFSQFLGESGYDVQSANSNDEAKLFINQESFDLILLDVHMKGIPFSEFLTFLKSTTTEIAQIPVIAVTGVPNLISKQHLHFLAGILEKPFTPFEMINYIETVLN